MPDLGCLRSRRAVAQSTTRTERAGDRARRNTYDVKRRVRNAAVARSTGHVDVVGALLLVRHVAVRRTLRRSRRRRRRRRRWRRVVGGGGGLKRIAAHADQKEETDDATDETRTRATYRRQAASLDAPASTAICRSRSRRAESRCRRRCAPLPWFSAATHRRRARATRAARIASASIKGTIFSDAQCQRRAPAVRRRLR